MIRRVAGAIVDAGARVRKLPPVALIALAAVLTSSAAAGGVFLFRTYDYVQHNNDFCLSCHPVEMPHPKTWTATHGRAVAEKGSPTCTTCHQANDCTACHGLPMPHPTNWGTAHPEAAERDRENCLLGHQQKDCEDCHAIHQTHGKGGGA